MKKRIYMKELKRELLERQKSDTTLAQFKIELTVGSVLYVGNIFTVELDRNVETLTNCEISLEYPSRDFSNLTVEKAVEYTAELVQSEIDAMFN